MSILERAKNWFKKESTPIVNKIIELPNRLQDAESSSLVNISKIPRVINPSLSYKNRRGLGEFEEAEYDMAEIGRIEDVESMVQRAFSLKEGLFFKEGYELVGKNASVIQYLKARFAQFSQASNIPFDLTLHGVGEDLVRFHNSILIKVRSAKASGGQPRVPAGKKATIQPVAAYFSVPFPTIKFHRDDNGTILSYRQQLPNGKYKDFAPDDVIHFYFRRKKGFLVGTPVLVSVKDDIRALRRIEENIEMLIYQCLFPLFQYSVGTIEKPCKEYSDGTSEVDVVKANIEIMPSEGMIVTPERHDIKAIGAEGRALRAEGYVNHFKERIIGGLGISAIDLGQGNTANRSTADSMSRNLVDDVKYYQRVLEIFINDYIIKELLLESTFENPLDEENIVRLEFREVDLDAKIKVENHAIQAFASHAITQTELRKSFGKEPLTDEEWDDTYWKLIMEPENLIRAVDEPFLISQGAIDNPNTSLTPQQSTEAQGKAEQQAENENDLEIKKIKAKPKLSSGQRQAASKSRPSNQHGRALGPTKRKSSFELGFTFDETNPILETYDNLFQNTMYSLTKGTFTQEWIRHIATTARQQMTDHMTRLVRLDFRKGLKKANYEAGQSEINVPVQFLENRISSYIARLMDTILKQLDNTKTREIVPSELEMYVSSVFDSLRFRSTTIYVSERVKAYNYGVLIGLQKRGIEKAKVINNEVGCEECQRHNESIPLLNATINDIPGFHPNCKCVIEEDKS